MFPVVVFVYEGTLPGIEAPSKGLLKHWEQGLIEGVQLCPESVLIRQVPLDALYVMLLQSFTGVCMIITGNGFRYL